MQLISQLSENWSAIRGIFGSMDPLEIFFSNVTSICWAVLSSDFRTDALMKTFSLYLKMLRSITSCKYSERSFMLEKWLWPNMCSLLLEQLCSKSYELLITIKFTEIFLATAGQLSWQQEDIFAWTMRQKNSKDHQHCISGNKPNESFSLSKLWIGTDYIEMERFALSSNTVNTKDHKRLFFNALSVLGLLHCGLRITLDN